MTDKVLYPWLSPVLDSLAFRLNQQSLHHGILLISELSNGESMLAAKLANKILCQDTQTNTPCGNCKACSLFAAHSHPDFHPVTTDKSQISVDSVRTAIEQVNKTAQMGGNKVILIENIERMSESASNALLKTLEEPTAGTYLVLTTNAPQYILATILSRCEKIAVAMPSYEQSLSYLGEKGIARSQMPSKLDLAAYKYSPLSYLDSLEDADARDYSFSQFKADLQALQKRQTPVESIANKWKDNAVDAAHWVAQISLQMFSRDVANSLDQSHSLVGTQWMSLYDEAVKAAKKLRQAGLNKALILSALFAQVPSEGT